MLRYAKKVLLESKVSQIYPRISEWSIEHTLALVVLASSALSDVASNSCCWIFKDLIIGASLCMPISCYSAPVC